MRRRLDAPAEAGGGVAGLLAHLWEISDDLDLLPPDEDETATEAGREGVMMLEGKSRQQQQQQQKQQQQQQQQQQQRRRQRQQRQQRRRQPTRDPRKSSIPALANAPEALRPPGALRSTLGLTGLTPAPRVSQVTGFRLSGSRRAVTETATAARKIRSEKLSIEAPAAFGAAALRMGKGRGMGMGGGGGGGVAPQHVTFGGAMVGGCTS
jgi:hypothetical protein